MDTKIFERFAVLDDMKKDLEAKLKTVKQEMAELESQIVEQSLEEGVESMTVKVGHDDEGNPIRRTVYRRRDLYAGRADNGGGSPISEEQLHEALREAGLEDYINEKVNANSLSAYVRGFDPDRRLSPEEIVQQLPLPLQGAVKVSEKLSVRSTKA